jgi:hypothetical protein
MAEWLWLLLLLAAAALLAAVGRALLRRPRPTAIAEYSGGLTLAGPVTAGRATYVVVQWLSDPADPAPCPLTVHLPAGDLGGEDLCDWAAPQTAAALEGPEQLDLFPFHGGRGAVAGVRVGLLPGCPAVEVSVGGTRLTLPLAEGDAVRLLGEPLRRHVRGGPGRQGVS